MGKKSRRKQKKNEQFIMEKKQKRDIPFLEKTCLAVIRWGVYLALFSPLIILKNSFFPFVTPKTIFFRIIVEIMAASYIILAIAKAKYRPNFKNPLFIAIFVFVLVLILTSLTGINFDRSFWSTYERMTGLFTFFHLLAFFVILTSCFKKRFDWEKILAVAIFVGVLLSLYILFSDKVSSRGGGTIGNTSFMAAYLLFDIFLAIILFLSNLPFKRAGDNGSGSGSQRSGSWAWTLYAGISLVIMIWNLMFSTARGAIFAFFAGLALLVLGYMFFSGKRILKRLSVAAVLLLIFCAVILAVFQPVFVKDKIAYTLLEMHPRFVMWKIAWQGWNERFWLGWGPENFNVVFGKYFNPCLFTGKCGGEIWFDRAHNIIFDTGVGSGLLGLLSYLSIFGVAIAYLLRVCRGVVSKKNLFIPLGVVVMLLAYLAQNVLVFDMINSYLMFFLALSFAGFLINKKSGEKEPEASPAQFEENALVLSEAGARGFSFRSAIAWPIIILLIFLLWFGNIKHLRSAQALAMTMMLVPNFERALPMFEQSLDSWMLKYEAREQFMQKLYQMPTELNEGEILKKAFNRAIEEGEKSIEKNPLDFRHHLFLSRVYITFYRIAPEEKYIVRAEEILQKAVSLSPNNQQAYWQIAEIRFMQRRYQEAVVLLEKAKNLEPSLQQSHWYLAIGYQLFGDYEKAREEVEKSQGYNWHDNLNNLNRVIHIYTTLNDMAALPDLYERAVFLQPKEPKLWANLVKSYVQTGQTEKAEQAIQRLTQEHPDIAPQVKELLQG